MNRGMRTGVAGAAMALAIMLGTTTAFASNVSSQAATTTQAVQGAKSPTAVEKLIDTGRNNLTKVEVEGTDWVPVINKVSEKDYKEVEEKFLGSDGQLAMIADITCPADGNYHVVKLSVASVKNGSRVEVRHKDSATNAWESLDIVEVGDGYVKVRMKSFSPVAVIVRSGSSTGTTTPANGSTTNTTTTTNTDNSTNTSTTTNTNSGNTTGDTQANTQTNTQNQNSSQANNNNQNQTNSQPNNNNQANTQSVTQENPQTVTQENPQNQTVNQNITVKIPKGVTIVDGDSVKVGKAKADESASDPRQGATKTVIYENGKATKTVVYRSNGAVNSNSANLTHPVNSATTAANAEYTAVKGSNYVAPKTGQSRSALPFAAILTAVGMVACGTKARKSNR